MSNFLRFVGENIRLVRKSQGLTQEELAELAGLQYTYIGGIERGERNISLETLEKVIDALKLTPYQLFKIQDFTTIEELTTKKQLVQSIGDLIFDRDESEIKKLHHIVKDIIDLVEPPK